MPDQHGTGHPKSRAGRGGRAGVPTKGCRCSRKFQPCVCSNESESLPQRTARAACESWNTAAVLERRGCTRPASLDLPKGPSQEPTTTQLKLSCGPELISPPALTLPGSRSQCPATASEFSVGQPSHRLQAAASSAAHKQLAGRTRRVKREPVSHY